MPNTTLVLIVEDEDQTRELLASVLRDAGYQVRVAHNHATALAVLEAELIDVVLSDIRLREESGIDLLARARARPLPPEVIMLTGYASLDTSIEALRSRAFDYLRKPVATSELLNTIWRAAQQRKEARQRAAAIRVLAAEIDSRAGRSDDEALGDEPTAPSQRLKQVGQLQIDLFRRAVTSDSMPLHLTPIEYALVGRLAETPGQVVASTELVRSTHGYEAPAAEAQALLRGHVRNLRRKLPDGYLVTVRGNGYMLVAPERFSRH